MEKRASSGLILTAAWTWSKFMDATSFLNNTDLYPAHAISDQDRTHRIVTSALHELPFARRKRWGGWQLN